MKKRVFIIHGWDGNPNKDWMPWVKTAIQDKGYEVFMPVMPDTEKPKIEPWVNKLRELVGQPNKDDILIGHSIGCQTIFRYLRELPEDQKVDKVILVAPWLKLTNLENDEAWEIAKPWLETPIDFSKVKPKAHSFIAIFSDNDQWVPLSKNKKMFDEYLNPQTIVLHNKGHFSEEENVGEIPELLDLL